MAEEEIKATPAAADLADEKNVDLASVPGTGADGKVTKADVAAADAELAAKEEAGEPTPPAAEEGPAEASTAADTPPGYTPAPTEDTGKKNPVVKNPDMP